MNFDAMKNTMALLWHSRRGVSIKDLSPMLFLFQFSHEIDVRRVLDSSPYFLSAYSYYSAIWHR